MIEISIIVPVLHEQERINSLIQYLEPFATQHQLEVIIVDGDRNGSTINHIYPYKSWVRSSISAPGRGQQMNHGARQAHSDVLLFLHADTKLPPNSLQNVKTILANPNIQGGAHDLKINSQNPALNWISRIASWRSRFTRIPYGDQAIFVRRSIFEAFGGYPDLPILEDVAFMTTLKTAQVPIQIIRESVLISDRRWQKEGILFTTLRNWTLIILFRLGISPKRLVSWYKPHQSSITPMPTITAKRH